MSNSDVLLTVRAGDEASEIYVVDGTFRVIARGVRSVETRVPPGIYRAKTRVGEYQREKLFTVDAADQPHKIVQIEPPEWTSPIPLEGTSTTHEYHQAAIAHAQAALANTATEARAARQIGHGASLVLFLRDPSKDYFGFNQDDLAAYAESFRGFVLRDWGGRFSYPLEQIGALHADEGYLIVVAEVDPGAYVLVAPARANQALCIPLVVSPDWSLQVYVSMDETRGKATRRKANLDDAAIVFDRQGNTFSPWREDLKLLETARHALARGHNILDESSMRELLYGKFENPMMGLIAAHLLLLGRQPDLKLADMVVGNTAQLIGADYPDLCALRWKLESLKAGSLSAEAARTILEKVRLPPMLRLSWDYLVEASRTFPFAMPFNEAPYHLASHVVSSSTWLSWVMPDTMAKEAPASRLDDATHRGATRDTVAAIFNQHLEPLVAGIVKHAGRTDAISSPTLARIMRAGETSDTDFSPALASVALDAKQIIAWSIGVLARKFDWTAVVRSLKQLGESSQVAQHLSPAQRQLVLALRSAQEQLADDGEISWAFVKDWLDAQNLPLATVVADLKRLGETAGELLTRASKEPGREQ